MPSNFRDGGSRRKPTLPTLTFRVRCSGKIHRIRWHRGRLQFLNHPSLATLRLAGLLGEPLGCYTVLSALSNDLTFPLERFSSCRDLPPVLGDALQTHYTARYIRGHGRGLDASSLIEIMRFPLRLSAVQRRWGSLVDLLGDAGLYVTAELPPSNCFGELVAIYPDHSNTFDCHPLAVFGNRSWSICEDVLYAAAKHMTFTDYSDPALCRVCHTTVMTAIDRSHHVDTPDHRDAVIHHFTDILLAAHRRIRPNDSYVSMERRPLPGC